MGETNSSITRVRPVFRGLFDIDHTGEKWLPVLLRLCDRRTHLAKECAENPGKLTTANLNRRCFRDRGTRYLLESCFERCLPPPHGILRWLILHPEEMKWPEQNGIREKFGAATQLIREQLFGRDAVAKAAVQEEGIRELDRRGAAGSRRKWWAFEGWTSGDCCLETDLLLLLVEGKRNEPLSPATKWYPQRNQLWRNAEVAGAAANGKKFATLLIAEQRIDAESTLESSFPHLTPEERDFYMKHYLGCILWKDLCGATGIPYDALPSTVYDVPPEPPC